MSATKSLFDCDNVDDAVEYVIENQSSLKERIGLMCIWECNRLGVTLAPTDTCFGMAVTSLLHRLPAHDQIDHDDKLSAYLAGCVRDGDRDPLDPNFEEYFRFLHADRAGEIKHDWRCHILQIVWENWDRFPPLARYAFYLFAKASECEAGAKDE